MVSLFTPVSRELTGGTRVRGALGVRGCCRQRRGAPCRTRPVQGPGLSAGFPLDCLLARRRRPMPAQGARPRPAGGVFASPSAQPKLVFLDFQAGR